MDTYTVLVSPVITEKVHIQKESFNKVAFKVNKKANKQQVKSAIEDALKVKVDKINILNQDGKKKRMGRFEGRRASYKKAIVTLAKGERVPLFEM